MKKEISLRLQNLPPVHAVVAEIAEQSDISGHYHLDEITWAARNVLTKAREMILQGADNPDLPELPVSSRQELQAWVTSQVLNELQEFQVTLRKVINATGVVLHTNCGRAVLASDAATFVREQAAHYSNLELDLATGRRGSRFSHVEKLLKKLTGAEAAMVVNNNAAAVLLIMNTLANQKEVIVSRGELVEIGGSFRIPEVLKAGGAVLMEVGTTNRTWLNDYRQAITEQTAILLKVHTSNFKIQGFQHSVPLKELVLLGEQFQIPVVEDLGSGSFIDGSEYGLPKEPTIQEAVQAGASLVTFSGDKLLGGPQAGIIVGKAHLVDQLKSNQLARALRVDKLTLSALLATLRLYDRRDYMSIPIWKMIAKDEKELLAEARLLWQEIKELPALQAEVVKSSSCVGGGAFPTAELPTFVCAVQAKSKSCLELEAFLRQGRVPILGRVFRERVLLDPRTLLPGDQEIIVSRLKEWCEA